VDQPLDPFWADPHHLQNFIESLRKDGYNIGVEQHVNAQALLLSLAAVRNLPDDPRRICSVLAPILCSSSQEQVEFSDRFDQWLSSFDARRVRGIDESTQSTLADELADQAQQERRWQWIKYALWSLAALIITFAGLQYFASEWLEEHISLPSYLKFYKSPTPTPTTPAVLEPELFPTSSFEQPNKEPEPTPTDDGRIQERAEWPSILRQWFVSILKFLNGLPELGIARGLFLAGFILLAGLIGYWIWFLRRAQLYLNRSGSPTEPLIEKLELSNSGGTLLSTIDVFDISREMRRRSTISSNELDISKTIDKTLQAGGWLFPVYKPRQAPPEYLFLIDRQSGPDDHQARFVTEIVHQLKKNEVFTSIYYFDGDPRLCYPVKLDRAPEHLIDLARNYSKHRLVIVADSRVLLNPITGISADWTDLLAGWTERFLLTPISATQWGIEEYKAAQQINVYALSQRGLKWLVPKHERRAIPLLLQNIEDNISSPLLPSVIQVEPQRWLEQDRPDQSIIENLLEVLETYLGRTGFYWLSACAVYPEIYWKLTTSLGYLLRRGERQPLFDSPLLLRLSRLPWFRYAYMPNWLRFELIHRLSISESREIRDGLADILVTALDKPDSGFELEVAQERSGATSRLAKSLLVLMGLRADTQDIVRDKVFLEFMLGKPLALAVILPKELNQQFRSQFRKINWKFVQVALALMTSVAVIIGILSFIIPIPSVPTSSPATVTTVSTPAVANTPTLTSTTTIEAIVPEVATISTLEFSCDQAANIPTIECEALVTIYENTNGPSWLNTDGWLTSTTPCEWFGITCINGTISRLQLSENGLTGTIPTELANLSQLEFLQLRNNQLSGSIPPQIGDLSNLRQLTLQSNNLSGEISVELTTLSQLEILRLTNNELDGPIPAEIGNLTNLQKLELSGNALSGSIPPQIGDLVNLTHLSLDSNILTGAIPAELANLSQLEFLYLQENDLSGSIPPQIGQLVNLQQLTLQSNGLSGAIPAELANLSQLLILRLTNNQLDGPIPSSLGTLANLLKLELGVNGLTGSIPPELGQLTSLTDLYLGENELTGTIPPQIGALTNLNILNLRNNGLSGPVPSSFSQLSADIVLRIAVGNSLYAEDRELCDFIMTVEPSWQEAQCELSTSTCPMDESLLLDALDICRELNINWACYARADATAAPDSSRFLQVGDRRPVTDLHSIATQSETGVVIIRLDIQGGDPKTLVAFGPIDLDPNPGYSQLFEVIDINGSIFCEETPSGMVIRTETGERGLITINGVDIELR